MQARFVCDSTDILGQGQGINAVEKLKKRQGMANLVLLEMSHEMPAQGGRQLRDFDAGLLHTALAENILPGLMRFAHAFRRMRFGDGH